MLEWGAVVMAAGAKCGCGKAEYSCYFIYTRVKKRMLHEYFVSVCVVVGKS
jgi:hypothetical protein